MTKPSFHILLTLFVLTLPLAVFSQASSGDIHITISKAPTNAAGDGVVEEKAVDIPAAVLKVPAAADKSSIIAAVFAKEIGKDEGFRMKIDNRSGIKWSFLIVEMSATKTCNSVMPFEQFSQIGFTSDSSVPVKTIAAGTSALSEWLFETGSPGIQRFAILASPDERKLQSVFMSVEFLAGLTTGRAEPNTSALSELKVGQPKAKSEAYEEYTAGRQRITITLGSVYSESGDVLRSAEYYDALLLIAGCRYQYNKGTFPFDALRVGWLNNRGLANYQTGNLAEAKKDYEAALEVLAKLEAADSKPRTYERMVTLTNLAQVYATLGDQAEAIKRYREAEALGAKLNPTIVEQSMSAIYGGLGTSLEYQRDYKAALLNYEKAYLITQRNGMGASEGIVLNSLGRLAANSGKIDAAEDYFKRAITLSARERNQAGIGSGTNNLGWLYLRNKRYAEAHTAFLNSAQIFADLGNRTAQATALGNLMFVEQRQNHPQAAIFFGKRAVELLQSVRGGLTGIEKQLQASFLVSREETYRSLIDNLISLDRLAEAQEIAKLLKEQEFASVAGTRAAPSEEVVPYSQAEEQVLQALEKLAELRRSRAALQAEKDAAGEGFTKQAELKAIDDKLTIISAAFQTTLQNLAQAEPSVSDRVKKIFEERNLQAVLSTLKKSHNTDAVAIYVVIGTEPEIDPTGTEIKDKVRTKFGWTVLVTSTDRKAYPIDVRGLDESVRRFRLAVDGDRYDPRPDAKKIYNAVFRQASTKLRTTLEADLDAALASSENKTVMWSLDGMLRYVPVAALHDGQRYLVEKYRNVVFTRQSLAQLSVPNVPQWKVLGMGVSDERPGFPALSGAAEELQYIVRPEMYAGKVLLNNEFKKDDALSAWRDKQYPVIHIASHFKFHPTKPDQSYLLLGDGELKIADIQFVDNLFDGVDLLALSACDTAMVSNGKESESFAYVAQDLGAKTVLASLWPVSDAGTPELMTRFYSLRLSDMSMTKGEAFHRAQLSLVRGEEIAALKRFPRKPTPESSAARAERFGRGAAANLPLFPKDERRPFSHPYYWAPFILIGNWR